MRTADEYVSEGLKGFFVLFCLSVFASQDNHYLSLLKFHFEISSLGSNKHKNVTCINDMNKNVDTYSVQAHCCKPLECRGSLFS